MKGRSDTTTKLLECCQTHLPVASYQASVIARLVMTFFVNLHRLSLMMSAKDIRKCHSLDTCRNTSNQRSTFRNFVNKSILMLFKKCDSLVQTPENNVSEVTMTSENRLAARVTSKRKLL